MGKIEVHNLTVKYNDQTILNHISESIDDGMTYALIGHSGSGTTTFLRAISGLTFYDNGSIRISGQALERFSKEEMLEYHKTCGFVFQQSGLINNMSIFNNLALYLYYHTKLKNEIIDAIIHKTAEKFGFVDDLDLRPDNLSIGEKKLVNVARAIIHNPQYIFWDEPDANLDKTMVSKIKSVFLEMKKQGKTMILCTHNIPFALSLADRIGILYSGEIIETSSPDEIGKSKDQRVLDLLEID